MSTSDSSSSLSSLPSTDDEAPPQTVRRDGTLDGYFQRVNTSPSTAKDQPLTPSKKRAPSPPHEPILGDNEAIAFIVMFRSRFAQVFAKNIPHFGPQELERGIADEFPNEQAEKLLCSLLGLVLNRKKDPERGHYHRALEEAVQTHSNQWPRAWNDENPLHGGITFQTMSPEQRLTLLRTLVTWALSSSDVISAIIKQSYKRSRQEDDLNQPLSVQPWGRDGEKRRYWLIEGQDDTHFRVYRESNIALKRVTWWSVASNIEELKQLATKLKSEGSLHSRRLSEKILAAVPRFETSEEKRKRRDYRLARKAQFARPEPGFSLYEGRTRGKKMKYTFSDEEDEIAEALGERRSRHSHSNTPGEQSGPTYTASGRRVKTRHGGVYGESLLSGQGGPESATVSDTGTEDTMVTGRVTRSSRQRRALDDDEKSRSDSRVEEYDDADELEAESEATYSNGEGDDADYDAEDGNEEDEDEEMSDDELDVIRDSHLMVSLRYRKRNARNGAWKSSAAQMQKSGVSNLDGNDDGLSFQEEPGKVADSALLSQKPMKREFVL